MTVAVVSAMMLMLALTVPPLTEAEHRQLETADDASRVLDEGAFYPLLHNALNWQTGDESGSMIPDYTAMMLSPSEFRGELFLIEGQLANRPRPIHHLARPGDWDGRLQQWSVLIRSDPDDVVVLYLVEPSPASSGQWVRLPARFYKVWADVDQHNQPTNYLVFVGHSARVRSTLRRGDAVPMGVKVFFVIVALMATAYLVVRRVIKQRMSAQPALRGLRVETPDREDDDLTLPVDPARALDELQRQHEARQATTVRNTDP